MGEKVPKSTLNSKKDDMDKKKKDTGKLSEEKRAGQSADLELPAVSPEKKKTRKKTSKNKKDNIIEQSKLDKGLENQKESRKKEFIAKYEELIKKPVEGGSEEEKMRFFAIQRGLDAEKIRNEMQENEELEKKDSYSVRAQYIKDLHKAFELVEREIETVSDQEGKPTPIAPAVKEKVNTEIKETDPQKIFEQALGALAKEKNLDKNLINDIHAFTDYRGFDPKNLERQIRLMKLTELGEKDEKLVSAIIEIIRVIEKEPGAGNVAGETASGKFGEKTEKDIEVRQNEVAEELQTNEKKKEGDDSEVLNNVSSEPGITETGVNESIIDAQGKEKSAEDETEKIKRFLEDNKLEDMDAINREISDIRKTSKKEWDPATAEKHKMLVRAFRYLKEKPENLDKEIVELKKNISEIESKIAGGNVPIEELESETKKLTGMSKQLERRQKQRGVAPEEETETRVEIGKELMVIRDRVIAEMAQGKSLTERRIELEALDSRNPEEQAELDYIIRGGRINAIVQIFVNVEGKDSKEYWEKYGASFFEGYEQALKDATEGGAKEPDGEKFAIKLLEYLPDEGNPKMAELKKGGGEVLKKITGAIGEIFKEKDPAKQEEKSGESKELQQIKKIMGEDGFKEFMKTLLEAKERKEKGELTPEEAAKQKEKLEKAKGAIGGSMEKAWSIAGLVGIMLLLGLIFMIIVELEAIDWMLKQGKGKH